MGTTVGLQEDASSEVWPFQGKFLWSASQLATRTFARLGMGTFPSLGLVAFPMQNAEKAPVVEKPNGPQWNPSPTTWSNEIAGVEDTRHNN